MSSNMEQLLKPDIRPLIRTVRDTRVILDSDLARTYGVETRTLNQAVKRNRDRFPDDFMFVLSRDELAKIQRLRSQTVI
jgi:DNA-binding XRE family transcriptional regulator